MYFTFCFVCEYISFEIDCGLCLSALFVHAFAIHLNNWFWWWSKSCSILCFFLLLHLAFIETENHGCWIHTVRHHFASIAIKFMSLAINVCAGSARDLSPHIKNVFTVGRFMKKEFMLHRFCEERQPLALHSTLKTETKNHQNFRKWNKNSN